MRRLRALVRVFRYRLSDSLQSINERTRLVNCLSCSIEARATDRASLTPREALGRGPHLAERLAGPML